MLKVPALHGIIRRRILANWRVDPSVVGPMLPSPLRPKLHNGFAIAGVCLIRLEQIRPEALKAIPLGICSENAAHRIAIEWDAEGVKREGVFIWRRDSNSWLNQLAGGRIFPGTHGAAKFEVRDDRRAISFSMRGAEVSIALEAASAAALPAGSVFGSLAEASRFFEGGAAGYSVTDDPKRLDGMNLVTEGWKVEPLQVSKAESSFYSDRARFPAGAATFDHAIIMRDLTHHWQQLGDMPVAPKPV